MHTFLFTCVREAQAFSDFPGQPSGPHGTMSSQTLSDVQGLITALSDLQDLLSKINPAFLPEVDLHSLLTLLVENLFAEMRGGSIHTPQVLDFARRFSSSTRLHSLIFLNSKTMPCQLHSTKITSDAKEVKITSRRSLLQLQKRGICIGCIWLCTYPF